MPGDEGDRGGQSPVRDRNSGVCGGGNAGRHPRNDLERNIVIMHFLLNSKMPIISNEACKCMRGG